MIAIGNPFGLGGTVTAGIVSAKHRVIGAGRFDDFMQIDAPINRGNSGGPTFDLEGNVIGVNTAIHSPTGGNVGIGFAIPANLAKEIVADLRGRRPGRARLARRPHPGASMRISRPASASTTPRARWSRRSAPDSPAAAAGLEHGDVILTFDGKPIERGERPDQDGRRHRSRHAVDVVVWRDGAELTLEVEIGQMPSDDQVVAAAEPPSEAAETPKLGVMLAELTPEARQSMELPDDAEGVVVTDVQPGSPAAEKGLQRGDVIVEADRKKVTEPKMVADAVREAAERGEETILLLVKREGQDRFVAVPLERA